MAADRQVQLSSTTRLKPAVFAALLALCLVALSASVAFATSSGGSATDSSLLLIPPSATTEGDFNALMEGANPAEIGPSTDPAAAEELPRTGLERSEAEDLLTAVFPSALEEAAGVFDDLEVENFHSDHVAIVSPDEPGGSPGLLTSLVPLRDQGSSGTKEQVDLGLEASGSELTPANPLVDVEIPSELETGIDLPEAGINVSLAGGPDRVGTIISDNAAAFYPNVAEDSDLVILPTPTGFETLTQLRTAEAPTTQTFDIDMPAGATLEGTPDGGAAVNQGGETIVVVRPPTAIDAEGTAVPVTMDVRQESLTLHASPPVGAAYPILVDPLFESYTWMNSNTNTGINTDWRSATNSSAYFKPSWLSNMNGNLKFGLNLWSEYAVVSPPAQASWNYYVPRYFTDFEDPAVQERPTSFIRNMTLSQVYFILEDSAPYSNDPRMYAALWDANKGSFASIANRNGAEGPWNNVTIYLTNPGEYTDVKNGGTALTTYESVSKRRQAFVGQATVELADKDLPGWAKLLTPSKWMNTTALEQLDYQVADSGLGVHALQLTAPKASGGSSQITTSNQCVGTASNPCPRKASTSSRTLTYDPALMAQGESVISVIATDPVGNQSVPRLAKIKVDHSAPGLSLSGNLTEQGAVGTKLPQYTLGYEAREGDEAAAAGETPIGSPGSGSGQLERPQDLAVDASGNIWVSDNINHRLLKFAPNGSLLKQVGSFGSANGQFNDPRGVASSSSGNVWVADSGNKRLQQFNSNGEFVRSITHPEFSALWGVATAPGGAVWVVDRNVRKAFKFRESDGVYLDQAGEIAASQPTLPLGIAADAYGNVWIVDHTGNRIMGYDSSGIYLSQFGSAGTGNGQFTNPVDIAVTASGNLLVTDRDNHRIQEFEVDGRYLRQFGSKGTASNQFNEPLGIATAPGGRAYIADAGNKRIAIWSHADQDPQSGAAKVEIKVDGTPAKTENPGCATKNCAVNGSWTLNADSYPVGAHKVDVIATDGVGLTTTKTLNIETHGDRADPAIALSGTMTQQASLGTTRPRYRLVVNATDPGSTEERKSGVASTTIKVDGSVVDAVSPGCPAEGCSITREWTLNSDSYSAGEHTVEVTATDGAGRSTVKTLAINIARDTTAPELTNLASFYTAPSGWVEQKLYEYLAVANDPNGYGVTSVQLKIDGAVVKSLSATCAEGGCSRWFGIGQKIDMDAYAGGDHPAELIATDGAGNTRKRSWTVNVDPNGQISVSEATDTMEAVEDTAPEVTEMTPVGALVTEAVGGEESNPELVSQEGQLVTEGAEAPSTISLDPEAGFAVETTGLSEEGWLNEESIEVTPLQVGPAASSPEITDGSAAVISNSSGNTDTILRPSFDGLMAFQAIRDATGPETYSWEVTLGAEESLNLLDPQHAAVVWNDGTQAMLITAQVAHDADGNVVATSLSVTEGNVITLTVHHRTTGIVYPVVAGVGWQGGFQTQVAGISNPEEEEHEDIFGEPNIEINVSAPILAPTNEPGEEAAASATKERLKKNWGTNICARGGCWLWKNNFRGYFYYNYLEAWYPKNRDPGCTGSSSLNVSITISECKWVGPNNQRYGNGYHITARTLFQITAHGGGYFPDITSGKAWTLRGYGSGGAYFHNTGDICNPNTSC